MLINLRNALMAGKRLPYDAEVEYLESTGTQWIDTGIIPDDTTGYFVRCSADSVGGNKVPCGQREGGGNTRWYVNFSSRLEFSWNNYLAVGAYNADTWYNIGFNWMNSRTGTTDGSAMFNISQQLTTRTRTAYAFANHAVSSAGNFFDGKIASLKISQGAFLVRDFIPVRKGTVGYLYDRVSGKLFGNAGTGDFVLGPDVVPVEYIESHGTEWIDTGLQPTSTTDASITFTATQSNDNWVMGAVTWWGVRCYFSTTPKQVEFANSPNAHYRAGVAYTQGDIATLALQGNEVFANGAKIGEITRRDASGNLAIFGYQANPGTANLLISGRVYSVKLLQSAAPVRSFRPVRVGTEGAMMDVLTRRIYRNAGTGAFTYGNDLKYPIPAS